MRGHLKRVQDHKQEKKKIISDAQREDSDLFKEEKKLKEEIKTLEAFAVEAPTEVIFLPKNTVND